MTAFVANTKSYDTDDLIGSNGYGYNVPTVAGDGSTYPLIIAMMVDLVNDSTKQMVTTSSTSLAIGTGSKTFTLGAELPIVVGTYGYAISDANSANFMFFQVTGWTAATKELVVNVTDIGGSGTLSDWNMALHTGLKGATGDPGADGSSDPDINTQSAVNEIAAADELIIYDDSAASNKKIGYDDFMIQMHHERNFYQ